MPEATAVILAGPRQIEWRREDLAVDRLGDDGLYCETLVSAISPGTEIAAYTGLEPLRPSSPYPRLVGYCNVARVRRAGAGVTRYRAGDLIVTHQSHRSAFICDESAVLARLPEGLDPAHASTAYLFHLGYSAVLRAQVRAGHSVAVIGLGAIGLGAVAMAGIGGADVVAISDRPGIAGPVALLGGHECRTRSEAADRRFDVVITTSNSWPDWHLALRLARTGGQIAVLGFPGRGAAPPDWNPLSPALFYDKQLTLIACGQVPRDNVAPETVRFTLARNMGWIVDRIASGDIRADLLISDTRPAQEIKAVYDRLESREPGLTTVVLTW